MANVIIIDDGAYQWGAERDELLSYLRSHNWTISGGRVEEPECKSDDPSDEPYTALCQSVQPAAGYGPDHADDSWDDLPHLTAWPRDGAGVWWLSDATAE